MKATKHFTRTDAIKEAKRVYGASFKDNVTLVHDGAFWVLAQKQLTC